MTEPLTIDEVLIVVEVNEAEFFVGDLFRRRFNTPEFPKKPLHFVAFAKLPDGGLLSLGYVHYTLWEGCALTGGLVIDSRHYKKLPASARRIINEAGGIAEMLLRQSFACLPDSTIAIWGYVGDKQSKKVCDRVGYLSTDEDYLLVVWRKEGLSDEAKQKWIKRAATIGPF